MPSRALSHGAGGETCDDIRSDWGGGGEQLNYTRCYRPIVHLWTSTPRLVLVAYTEYHCLNPSKIKRPFKPYPPPIQLSPLHSPALPYPPISNSLLSSPLFLHFQEIPYHINLTIPLIYELFHGAEGGKGVIGVKRGGGRRDGLG